MKQLLFYSLLALFIPFNSSFAQVLHGSTTVSSVNNMTIDITVDVGQSEVTIVMTGPSSTWFGYGFGGTAMFNRYSIITTGTGAISERRLGNHNSGTLLTSSFSSSNTSVNGSIRTDTVKRAITGLNSNYFTFPTTAGSFMLIWGKGFGSSLANHGGGNRGSAMITLSPLCSNTSTQLNDTTVCFGDSIQFGGQYISTAGQYVDTLTVAGGCDSIIHQNIAFSMPGPFPQPSVDICNGDSLMIFGNYQSTAGIYVDTLTGPGGCDSIVSQQLTVTVVDTSLTYIRNINRIQAFATNASFQWLENCNTTPTPMPGETDSVLIAPTDTMAYYAVVVTQNGCVDTSRCVFFQYVLNLEEGSSLLGSIHPNPFKDKLHVELQPNYQNASLFVLSLSGQIVKEIKLDSGLNQIEFDLHELEKGTYILQSNIDGKLESRPIVKN